MWDSRPLWQCRRLSSTWCLEQSLRFYCHWGISTDSALRFCLTKVCNCWDLCDCWVCQPWHKWRQTRPMGWYAYLSAQLSRNSFLALAELGSEEVVAQKLWGEGTETGAWKIELLHRTSTQKSKFCLLVQPSVAETGFCHLYLLVHCMRNTNYLKTTTMQN